MKPLAFLLVVSLGVASLRAADNPCSNGSFEQLAASGFPADWAPLGRVEVSTNAHSGGRCLRLVRGAEPPPRETGLNRIRLLPQLRGGMEFWYRAVSAEGARLRLYVIPVNAAGVEKTGSPRATFTVPADHIGDGTWHRERLRYDFSTNPEVKAVHFAARLEGGPGELFLDDFAYLDQVGPLLRFGTVRMDELGGENMPGKVYTTIENAGDAPATNATARLELPPELRARPPEVIALGDLPAGKRKPVAWTVEGVRDQTGALRLIAASAAGATATRLALEPRLEIVSCGPESPVAVAGRPLQIECLVTNSGHVSVTKLGFSAALGEEHRTEEMARLAPGCAALLITTFTPRHPARAQEARLWLTAGNLAACGGTHRARVIVVADRKLPPPGGKPHAATASEGAVLENERVRLVFPRSDFGFGPGELSVRGADGTWRRVAWVPGLARMAFAAPSDEEGQLVFTTEPPQAVSSANGAARLRFQWTAPGGQGRLSATFELAADSRCVVARHEFVPHQAGGLHYFEGPMLYALSAAGDRREALFPGVEWLVAEGLAEEVSSGTLDIAETHPDRIRHRVHPNWITIPALSVHTRAGTVGLLWEAHQKWDGTRDRPGAVFSSPDRVQHQRAHRLGLFAPAVPEFVKANTWRLETLQPYPLEPGRTLRLEALIYADADAPDALTAVDEWVRRFGLPQPAPLPRGSYEREIEFSMQGYLKSLWVPEEKTWWTSKGGGNLSSKGRPRDYVADLLVGELLSPEAAVRRACRARAEEVLAIIGGEARLDAQRFPALLAQSLANPAHAANLLAQRDAGGVWRFDADQEGTGPFVGLDYHELGPDEAVEVGICARRAFEVLRYARITGDREAYEQMQPTLQAMAGFRVPRAAQVWEVPVHTPDILAAGEACEAFLEAYRFSGEERWRREAVAWARRGLPFVYLWDVPERPFLLGATIPVFGATWMQGSWFGRPVQWNGLRYAEALLKLPEHDRSRPWRQIAEMIIRSALHQQDAAGENVALWPDNIGAVAADKCPWVFAPRMIIQNVLKLLGRDENPATVILGRGERRLHLTAAAPLSEAVWDRPTCSFRVVYPRGEQGVVSVYNVSRPTAVFLDGAALREQDPAEVVKGATSGWSHDEANACLSIRITRDGSSAVRIEGAAWEYVARLPQLAERIAFEFEKSAEGWLPLHEVRELRVREGALAGRITGGDPYLGRWHLRVRGDTCPVVRLRLRVSAGQMGQLYWGTEAAPGFSEERTVRFALQADGQFHEYRLAVGEHRAWAGQTITALRLDPGNGAARAEFAVDYITGTKD